jgi:perosamine synthetase
VSAETISKAITPKTKVIVVVHLYGQPADMDPILDLAAERQLTVIEDAAEAHGALYKGRKVGSLGRLGVFSFYGNKLITSGEGGMITTKDESLAQRVRFLRDHAMSAERRYFHPEIGYNYRITNLQAALGVAQLERIAGFIAQRRRVMEWYREALGHRSDLTLNPALPWAESANWMVSVLLPRGVEADEIARSLRESGIDTRPFFHPLHQLPPFAQFHQCHMPVAEDLSRRGLNLPTSGRLRKADVRYIARALERAVDHSCNSVASWLGGEERHLSR